jgi:hypothetical protein
MEVPSEVGFVDTAFGSGGLHKQREGTIYGDPIGKEKEVVDLPHEPKRGHRAWIYHMSQKGATVRAAHASQGGAYCACTGADGKNGCNRGW